MCGILTTHGHSLSFNHTAGVWQERVDASWRVSCTLFVLFIVRVDTGGGVHTMHAHSACATSHTTSHTPCRTTPHSSLAAANFSQIFTSASNFVPTATLGWMIENGFLQRSDLWAAITNPATAKRITKEFCT